MPARGSRNRRARLDVRECRYVGSGLECGIGGDSSSRLESDVILDNDRAEEQGLGFIVDESNRRISAEGDIVANRQKVPTTARELYPFMEYVIPIRAPSRRSTMQCSSVPAMVRQGTVGLRANQPMA